MPQHKTLPATGKSAFVIRQYLKAYQTFDMARPPNFCRVPLHALYPDCRACRFLIGARTCFAIVLCDPTCQDAKSGSVFAYVYPTDESIAARVDKVGPSWRTFSSIESSALHSHGLDFHSRVLLCRSMTGKDAYCELLTVNALDPTVFPSSMKLECEVVSMIISTLHGGPDVVGNFSSGGTESCFLAVKTARDWARGERKIARPEIVVPDSVHPAFHKAGHLLDVKPVRAIN